MTESVVGPRIKDLIVHRPQVRDFCVITVGCPRNEVASDYIIQSLTPHYTLNNDPESADVIIINTCGFISEAKEESLRALFDVIARRRNRPPILALAGCLTERYRHELEQLLPEAEIIIGIERFESFAPAIRSAEVGQRFLDNAESPVTYRPQRQFTSRRHAPYIQIADGCDEKCPYCAIPAIRGMMRSRRPEDVIKEAKYLLTGGARELNLVAQDIGSYGIDLDPGTGLAALLSRLDKIAGDFWIRCLYLQPYRATSELANLIAKSRHICRYLDIPLQHGSDAVLKRMGRLKQGLDSTGQYLATINRLRATIEGLALRSTFMIGYPGETRNDFLSLCRFLEAAEFEYAGFFVYSPEDGTPAARLNKRVAKATAARRLHEIADLQSEITFDKLSSRIGQEVCVLIEKYDASTAEVVGRCAFQAPEIDGEVRLKIESDTMVGPGEFVNAVIKATEDFDLICEVKS